MKRNCLECGGHFTGRSDKKFCSDLCRNAYNNKVNVESKNVIRNINNRLKKNYRILDQLCPEQKTSTQKSILLDKGFQFNYITNLYTTQKGTVYYFIYDIGYLPLENDYYMIVRREK